jgi:HEAT repeat protein
VAIAVTSFAQSSAEAIMSRKPAELIETLKNPAAPTFEKAMACQQLARIGTIDATAALVALLPDEKLNAYARTALEAIAGPAVDEALRSAAPKLQGLQLVGVINSIGQRRDARAAGLLKALLDNSDPAVVSAAAGALGRIGTPEAAGILREAVGKNLPVKEQIAESCLACADRLAVGGSKAEAVRLVETVAKADVPKYLKAAAIYGRLRLQQAEAKVLLLTLLESPDSVFFNVGLAAAREMPGEHVTAALAGVLDELPPDRQALLLRALGDRKGPAPLSRVIAASRSQSPAVRSAAIYALARHGDARALPILLDAALGEGEVAQTAKEGINALPPGKDADGAITAKLAAAVDPTATISLLELVGARGIAAAVPEVLRAADDRNEEVRLAAIHALGRIIGVEELPALIGRLIAAKTPQETAAAEEALKTACARMPDREACGGRLLDGASRAPMASKRVLFRLLASVGGARWLQAVGAYARCDNEEIQDAATQALGEWISADAAPELLDLAKTLRNDKFKIRALRGYIRIVRQMGIPADQKVAMCEEALQAAQRDDERRLVFRVLANIPSARSLSLVVGRLATPALKEDAIAATIAIAEKIIASDPSAVAEAMRKVLQAGAHGEKAARAKALLEQATLKSHPISQ